MDNHLAQWPEIGVAYQVYMLCREQQMVSHTISKGGKEYNRTEPFTTGLSVLPEEGGLLDQPQRLMTFFEEFIAGERRSFGK